MISCYIHQLLSRSLTPFHYGCLRSSESGPDEAQIMPVCTAEAVVHYPVWCSMTKGFTSRRSFWVLASTQWLLWQWHYSETAALTIFLFTSCWTSLYLRSLCHFPGVFFITASFTLIPDTSRIGTWWSFIFPYNVIPQSLWGQTGSSLWPTAFGFWRAKTLIKLILYFF